MDISRQIYFSLHCLLAYVKCLEKYFNLWTRLQGFNDLYRCFLNSDFYGWSTDLICTPTADMPTALLRKWKSPWSQNDECFCVQTLACIAYKLYSIHSFTLGPLFIIICRDRLIIVLISVFLNWYLVIGCFGVMSLVYWLSKNDHKKLYLQ